MQDLVIRRAQAAALVISVALGGAASANWPFFAGRADRTATATSGPRNLHELWHVTPQADEEYISSATPVVSGGRVFVLARCFRDFVHEHNRAIAYHAASGARLWHADVEPDFVESWSSPAVDAGNQTVIVASGSKLTAIEVASGGVAWETPLSRNIVNASPVVTSDLTTSSTPSNRLFITDFNPFGTATLYAINVDAFHAASNPHDPGDIVWTAALNGGSGNSPAYAGGRVYVATAGGAVRAFDVRSGTQLWSRSVSATMGFFGGVSVRGKGVFAATYNFDGGESNSLLAKIDADSGALLWTIPCERTDSTPVLPDGDRIFLAGGISGFGSAVKVQAFEDKGTHAALLWETSQSDGPTVGGWTGQPSVANHVLYVGTPASDFGFYTDLYTLDLKRRPGQPDFVIDQHAGSGGAVALAGRRAYSIGVEGLFCFERGFAAPSEPAIRELRTP